LRDPKFTLACAGAAAGFADQSHFTKVFRQIVGVTPMRFRGEIGYVLNHAQKELFAHSRGAPLPHIFVR
jgi:AraC-like DNA-binding protein